MNKKTKRVISNTLVISVILFFAMSILFSSTEIPPLQGGDIQKSIETGQYK
jgi:hypothetical protein